MIATKPNALTRLRAAYQFYRHGWRKFQPLPIQTKKVPLMWPSWLNNQPQWQMINYEAYASEGFNANAVIYSAIMYKVRSITIAPLRAYTGTPEEPELLPPKHPLQQLCMRPNRFQSWSEFQAMATVYFNLAGNNYTAIERQGDEITGLYHLRPDRIFIVPTANKRDLIGYWYVPEGVAWEDGRPYMPQDIIHIKLPNPLDPLEGLGPGISPLSPAAYNGDVDNDLTKFFRLFFKNGAMPQGFLSFEEYLDDEALIRAQERWTEIYGGSQNWADRSIGTLDAGASFQRIGFSFQEMDVSAIDARNESRIVAPFGVPLNLIESRPELVQSTYSNKENDRLMFWQDTMIPELKWFETDYQYYLQSGDAFVMFDLGQIPALNMTKAERLERVQKAYEAGAVLTDELRAELGLDPMPEEEQPLELEPVPPPTQDDTMEEQPEAMEEAEDDSLKKKSIDRLGFWTKADNTARDFEPEFWEAGKRAFEYDRIYIEAIINDANRQAQEMSASLNWLGVMDQVNTYFITEAAKNWQRNFALPLYDLMSARAGDLERQFKSTKQTVGELLAEEWFNEYTITFAQPINATTEEQIRRVIEQGLNEGWTVPQLQTRIKQVFDQWMTGALTAEELAWFTARLPDYRLEMIARTETIKAMNTISQQLFDMWGVQEKEWLATQDKRVRDAHAAADGQRVRIDEAFHVGGESLMYPGDPNGSPENIINCRCTILPVV